MTKNSLFVLLQFVFILVAAAGGSAQGAEWTLDKDQLVEKPDPYSPFVDQHFPQEVYFGDTHFHSSLSVDSGLIGNKIDLESALRFARGEEVATSTGQRVQLNRPLDFLVLSDHAEYLGIADLLNQAHPGLLGTEVGREWYEDMQAGGERAWNTAVGLVNDFNKGAPRFRDPKIERSVWERVVDTASSYNEPGTFTALNGYEWSTSTGGSNLHRVVVFQDGSDRVKQVLPFGAFDSTDPEDLWAFMAGYEAKTGGRVMAIPHNPNLSNGVMFAERVNGKK